MDLSSAGIAREFRITPEEARHLHLRLQPARGKAFEGLLDDAGKGLVADQHLALAGAALVAVADGRVEYPVAVQRARPHAVDDLLGVLLPLVLRHAGQKVLDQETVGILAELDGGRFELAAGLADGGAQLEVSFEAAGKAADVVDDHHRAVFSPLAQEGQHRLHARPAGEFPRDIVGEGSDDVVALVAGIFAAAGLLRVQTVALLHLPGGRHPGVDDGLVGLALPVSWHRSSSPRTRP